MVLYSHGLYSTLFTALEFDVRAIKFISSHSVQKLASRLTGLLSSPSFSNRCGTDLEHDVCATV